MDIDRSESQANLQKLRERTKSVGDVPRQIFLPYSSRFQVSSSFKFHVFLLLQMFLNVCYFFLVIPFRFRKSHNKFVKGGGAYYILQESCLQKILSFCIILVAIVFAFLDLRYWLEQNLRENPHQAFRYASNLIKGFIPLLWAITFWLKKKWFAKLLVVCQGKKEGSNLLIAPPKKDLNQKNRKRNVNVKPSLRLRLIVVLMVLLTLVKVGYEVGRWNLDELLRTNIHITMYDFRLLKNWSDVGYTFHLNSTGDINTMLYFYGIGAGSTLLFALDIYLENMFDLFCLIGGAMVFAVCNHFADEMEKLSRISSSSTSEYQQSKRILKLMQTNYVDLIAILESINEVFGPLIVLYFLRAYPTLVWSVFGLFRKVTLDAAIFHLHKILVFALVSWSASEGSSKVQQFKQWLFHTSVASNNDEDDQISMTFDNASMSQMEEGVKGGGHHIDMTSLNILHREVSTETLGLKGYKFFTVTHGLIGTMIGIVVTYAIVMLQFEMDVEESRRSTTLGLGSMSNSRMVAAVTTTMPTLSTFSVEDSTTRTLLMENYTLSDVGGD